MKRSGESSDVEARRSKQARMHDGVLVLPIPSMRELMQRSKQRISKPVQVSGFSKYPDGHVTYDRSLLKLLKKAAPLNSDLLEGMDAYAEPPNTAPLEHVIDAMLPANRHLHNHTTDAQPLPKYHVVTYRNNLNKIMGTPYNTNSAYTMQMQRIQGCVYLNVTLSHIPPSSFSSNQAQGAYAGRRYEVLSSAAVGGGEYCGVFSVSLGQKKLLIGAEMDGVTASKDDDDDTTNYVELKTFRILNTPKDRFTFERYKLLAFWIQSYLVGVPTIRVGFRNESFILTKEQAFETADLPRYGDKHWVLGLLVLLLVCHYGG
ncbi:hypothetical protein, variant 1 [Aphanomyces astaci]|uniref:Decapping nuclease n=1 Tax=Aphanomyces astaci TaxID=112090 RepID=W4FX68_APHAT|nr:hypothetical protein, variant 1 [Aphanomyces astaci]ETV72077.1 hypothetical protein, variant 1 [Aphanomyces astaci]|eukprot:XP_009838520.1 hypothetical protein, variant 1 [Aphanomyces astaci]